MSLSFSSPAFSQRESKSDDCEIRKSGLSRQASDVRSIAEQCSENERKIDMFSVCNPQGQGEIKFENKSCRFCLSKDEGLAKICIDKWNKLDLSEKANRLYEGYSGLIKAHQLSYRPELMVCKAYNESTFNAGVRGIGKKRPAYGLGQVLGSTADDFLDRGRLREESSNRFRWFKSVVPGYKDIKNGLQYYDRMGSSLLAQLELGLGVFHQKSLDFSLRDERSILKRYRGASGGINEAYASRIINCANCLTGNINSGRGLSMECIIKAGNSFPLKK